MKKYKVQIIILTLCLIFFVVRWVVPFFAQKDESSITEIVRNAKKDSFNVKEADSAISLPDRSNITDPNQFGYAGLPDDVADDLIKELNNYPIAIILGDTVWSNELSYENDKIITFYLENRIKMFLGTHRTQKDHLKLTINNNTVDNCEFTHYLYKKYGGKLYPSKLGCINGQKPKDAIIDWYKYEISEGNLKILDKAVRKAILELSS